MIAHTPTPVLISDRPRTAPFHTPYAALPDPRGFFEAVLGFDQLDDQWFRVPADAQRRYFGNVPFGKCAIKIASDGMVTLFKSQAYGKDWDEIECRFDHSSKCWTSADDERRPFAFLPCRF